MHYITKNYRKYLEVYCFLLWNKGLFPQCSNGIRLIEGAVPIHLRAGLEPRIKKIIFLPVQ